MEAVKKIHGEKSTRNLNREKKISVTENGAIDRVVKGKAKQNVFFPRKFHRLQPYLEYSVCVLL